MVVKHPLSGAARFSGFSLDAGRLCVMLSRHQLACLVVTRDGLDHTLEVHKHESDQEIPQRVPVLVARHVPVKEFVTDDGNHGDRDILTDG